jgi:hypothetical protein
LLLSAKSKANFALRYKFYFILAKQLMFIMALRLTILCKHF